jgi:hypothetical protein
MKRVPLLVLLGLAGTAILPAHSVAATSSSKPVPVVATFFSNLAPRAGQHETVTVQYYLFTPRKKPQYIRGAHLSVTVELGTMKIGTRVLKTVRGTTTNSQGKAFATFTIPGKAKGKVLWAYTTVTSKGVRHVGSNRVIVDR